MMYKHKNKRIKYISNEVKHVWKYFASRIKENLKWTYTRLGVKIKENII